MSGRCLKSDGDVRRRRGGITVTFPAKLHALLMEIERGETFRDIIHWSSNGSTFAIQQRKEFTDILLPEYFRARRFESFERQLRGYGFARANPDVNCDRDVYVYYHELFHRDRPEHTKLIKRRYSLTDLSKGRSGVGLIDRTPMLRCFANNEARALAVVSPPETPSNVASAFFPDIRKSDLPIDPQSQVSWLQFASSQQLLVPLLFTPLLHDTTSDEAPGREKADEKRTSHVVDDIRLACDALCDIASLPLHQRSGTEDRSTSNAEFSSSYTTALDEAAATITWDDETECSLRSLAELSRMWDPEVETLSPTHVVPAREEH